MVCFKKGRSLKDLLVLAKLPEVNSGYKGCEGCQKARCHVCPFIKATGEFYNSEGDRTYEIRSKETLTCASKCVVYLINCKTCNMKYMGSASTEFCKRFNNYKSCHKKHVAGGMLVQASFHEHFSHSDHFGQEDWKFILIDKAVDLVSVRKKGSFWQHILDTYMPKGCLLYTSPSPRDGLLSRMPSSA